MGAFLGNVFVVNSKGEKLDVSKALLDSGMGYLHESFDPREPGGGAFKLAEATAREAKVGLWKDYVEPEAAEDAGATTVSDTPTKTVSGTVCEVGFGGRIFIQGPESAATIKLVEAGLADLKLDAATAPPVSSLKPAESVAAKFSADGLWYRAKVLTKTADGARVRFVDYGNEESVKAQDIRRPAGGGAVSFMSRPAAAIEARLPDLVIPEANEACGYEAGQCIRDLVFGKKVDVLVRGTERGVLVGDIVIPADKSATAAGASVGSSSTSPVASSSSEKTSLTEKLLESGMVRLVRKSDRSSKAVFNRLSDFEKVGQATRDGLWVYGDAYESDCDDEEEVRERNKGRRGF